MSEAYPPFKLNGYRHDQSSFSGRLQHFLEVIDPRTLLTTRKQLDECTQLLEAYRQGTLPQHVTDRELWLAQKTKQAIIHPDTGEKIFMPFRMSGYVPFGTPIVVGLLLPGPSLLQTVFWQSLNQSHNALVNYANRNATKPTPISRFLLGYIGAVTSAVSIAVGMNVLLDKAKGFSTTTKYLMQRFIPYPAVACANVCNVVLMRNNELTTGIDVTDKDGHVVGTSQVAARKAVLQTAATRVFLPAPVLLLPPIIMSLLEKTRTLRLHPRLHLPVSAAVCTLCFGGGLPIAIALFPQISEIATDELEPEIRRSTTDKSLFYNKGL